MTENQFNAVRPAPGSIVVPRKHREVLTEPPFWKLTDFLLGHTKKEEGTFLGVPLAEARDKARQHFLEAVREWGAKTNAAVSVFGNGPWIFTGHQVEFYHAGVWAKVIAADEMARRVGGVAFDLLVDHDVVEQRGFDLPEVEEKVWRREAVDYAEPSVVPAEGLKAPSKAVFDEWAERLRKHAASRTNATEAFLQRLAKTNEKESHAAWMSEARKGFEDVFGLRVWHVPTSLVCWGESWESFVRGWVENAEQWNAIYNKHLAVYRAREGISNPQQPMPDLARDGDEIELPFWVYRRGEARQRFFVRKNGWIVVGDEECQFGEVFRDFEVRPRALTLTMYARMFLADLFIHGIGGALYDQITDGIIEELFGGVFPYGCVSAAWLLPLGEKAESAEGAVDLPGLIHWRHHLAHNPQQGIDVFTADRPEVGALIRGRQERVEKMAASLAVDRHGLEAKILRRQSFGELHQINQQLHEMVPKALRRLDMEIAKVREAREQNKVLLWREWFFGLHTTESLRELIAAVRDGGDAKGNAENGGIKNLKFEISKDS